MAEPGGKIAPDGRDPQAPGVGKDSKRHDLEEPKTPGLHDSDLQQGDVQALEAGQRIAPAQHQGPAMPPGRPGRPERKRRVKPSADGTPDPIEFLGDRLGGTLSEVNQHKTRRTVDYRPFLPLLERLASATGASGIVAHAYITQFGNAVRGPMVHSTPMIDMQDADDDLEAFLEDRNR